MDIRRRGTVTGFAPYMHKGSAFHTVHTRVPFLSDVIVVCYTCIIGLLSTLIKAIIGLLSTLVKATLHVLRKEGCETEKNAAKADFTFTL